MFKIPYIGHITNKEVMKSQTDVLTSIQLRNCQYFDHVVRAELKKVNGMKRGRMGGREHRVNVGLERCENLCGCAWWSAA